MSNHNPKHNARANAKKALGARRAKEEKAKRLTKAQKEAARIDAVVALAKKHEGEEVKNSVNILHYDARRISFRARATKLG